MESKEIQSQHSVLLSQSRLPRRIPSLIASHQFNHYDKLQALEIINSKQLNPNKDKELKPSALAEHRENQSQAMICKAMLN